MKENAGVNRSEEGAAPWSEVSEGWPGGKGADSSPCQHPSLTRPAGGESADWGITGMTQGQDPDGLVGEASQR